MPMAPQMLTKCEVGLSFALAGAEQKLAWKLFYGRFKMEAKSSFGETQPRWI